MKAAPHSACRGRTFLSPLTRSLGSTSLTRHDHNMFKHNPTSFAAPKQDNMTIRPHDQAQKIAQERSHLRNHLHSVQCHLSPSSLRQNPRLLDVSRVEKLLLQLDAVAFAIATTPHGVHNRLPVWQYNPFALKTWFGTAWQELHEFTTERAVLSRVSAMLRRHPAEVEACSEDRKAVGCLPTGLINPAKDVTFTNPEFDISLTGLLRPSAVFVKMLSMLQDLAMEDGMARDDAIWILGQEEGEERTVRKCLVFLAMRCAALSLLNSLLVEGNEGCEGVKKQVRFECEVDLGMEM